MPEPSHILLVEDDADVAEVLAAVLENAGFRVSTAGRRQDAEAVLREGSVDLIVSDSVLRGENGGALAASADAPIILTSCDPAWIEKLRDGPLPFLQKPFGALDLLLFVRQVLGAARRKQP